ncbi:hypothetical protein HDU76_001542 [Blyttiomyces sp. JEL0837]|nr:hypothetical protein HDU76_001542 [Blyttiomyces sp. JEL0837]
MSKKTGGDENLGNGEMDDVFSAIKEHMMKRSAERHRQTVEDFERHASNIRQKAMSLVTRYQKQIDDFLADYKKKTEELVEERQAILEKMQHEHVKVAHTCGSFHTDLAKIDSTFDEISVQCIQSLSERCAEVARKLESSKVAGASGAKEVQPRASTNSAQQEERAARPATSNKRKHHSDAASTLQQLLDNTA